MDRALVYFLCTGNSCRSQMAEGWARALGEDVVEARSAGLKPAGVHPYAIRVMDEAGVDISGQTAKAIDPALLAAADYVITLCGDARDQCPVLPDGVRRLHWGFPDPAQARGSEETILQAFRTVRDGIRERIESFVDELRAHRSDERERSPRRPGSAP